MNVPSTIDAASLLGKYLEGANGGTDLARSMLGAFAEALMSAEASMQCNAGYGERTPERENQRNGYRLRPWDTRVGSIELAVPKLRRGGYSPEFLLQPRRRAEQALVSVVCAAYVEGVSTRRVDDLVKAMGIDGISKSEVSRMAQELDKVVTEFKDHVRFVDRIHRLKVSGVERIVALLHQFEEVVCPDGAFGFHGHCCSPYR